MQSGQQSPKKPHALSQQQPPALQLPHRPAQEQYVAKSAQQSPMPLHAESHQQMPSLPVPLQ